MTGIPELRDYQARAIDELREGFKTRKRILLYGPTGAGKTTVFSFVAAGARVRGKSTIIIAHRRELIAQASARLDDYGIDHGIIMAGHWRKKPWLPVQVASIDTLRNRSVNAFDLIVIDEAHHSVARSYVEFVESQTQAKVLGVSATPFRMDGKGLGDAFDGLVRMSSVRELIDLGYLVPPRMFAPTKPDLSGIKIKNGDFDQEELARRIDRQQLVGDIVHHWRSLASDRQTIVFAVNVAHSKHIVDNFVAAGVRAEHLDAETPKDQRDAILKRLASGQTSVVSNVAVLTEGTDIPNVSAIVLARPTQSRVLYIQAAGRGLRTAPGKRDCLVLDHGGNCLMHGSLTAPLEITLEDGLGGKKAKRGRLPDSCGTVIQCKSCYAIFDSNRDACPECGDVRKVEAVPTVKDGELKEVDFDKDAREHHARQEVHLARTLEDLLRIEKARGYKRGWARHVFMSRTAKRGNGALASELRAMHQRRRA